MDLGRMRMVFLVFASLWLVACDRGSSTPVPAEPGQFTVTAAAGSGGGASPASQQVAQGETAQVTVTPETGYGIASVTGCGGSLSGNVYTTGPVNADCTVTASFAINTYTVSATAGTGGSIEPASRQVDHGATASFELVPDAGFEIDQVDGCAGSLSGATYMTGAVTAACEVSASFAPISLEAPANVQAEAGVGQVRLSWDAVPGAVDYNVYYGENPGISIATAASYDELLLGVGDPHTVTGLSNGTEYHFVVTAAAGPAESPASDEVSATPFAGAVSTFFGGSLNDTAYAVLVHPLNGDVYMIGTQQNQVPVTEGAWITTRTAATPGMLARFTPDLGELVAATYLPGNAATRWTALIADPVSGDLFIGGNGSPLTGVGFRDGNGDPVIDPDTGLPYVPYQASGGGNSDGTIVRLKADLSAPIAATNYGIVGNEYITGLALHPDNGDLYAFGRVHYASAGQTAPGVDGGAQPSTGKTCSIASACTNGLVLRFSPQLHDLRQATYLGGTSPFDQQAGNYDTYPGIVIHPDTGDIYVANSTASTDFPTTPGALQESVPGTSTNGYVTRLNAGLTEIAASTYFGGSGIWGVNGLAVNAAGEIVIGGRAGGGVLPGVAGGAQETPPGGAAGFVARLTPDLAAVVQSSYLRGVTTGIVQTVNALRIHPVSGEVYVTGHAGGNTPLPAIEGALLDEFPITGAFVTRFNGALTEIVQSSWVGAQQNHPFGLDIDAAGDWVYVSLTDNGATYAFSEEGAFPDNPGGNSAVVSRLRSSLAR